MRLLCLFSCVHGLWQPEQARPYLKRAAHSSAKRVVPLWAAETRNQHRNELQEWDVTSVASLYVSPAPREEVTVRERDGRILPIPQQRRYRSRDWLRNLAGIPSSKTLLRIRSPVVGMTCWGLIVGLLHERWEMGLGFTFLHGLMGSTLSLLLTFRTNAAYHRYWEGRTEWQKVVDRARDLARLTAVYADCLGAARHTRVRGLVASFPLALEYHLQGRKSAREAIASAYVQDIALRRDATVLPNAQRRLARHYATKAASLDRRPDDVVFETETSDYNDLLLSVPGANDAAQGEYEDDDDDEANFAAGLGDCANRPLFIANALAAEFRDVPNSDDGTFGNRERAQLIGTVNSLATAVGACERLIMTPVPLMYARHTSRILSLWCLTLPFVIAPALGVFLTPVALALVSWALFGIQEIGLIIEDPFRGALKLGVLSDIILCDIRETSMYFTRGKSMEPRLKKASTDHSVEVDEHTVENSELRANGNAPPASLGMVPSVVGHTRPGLGAVVSAPLTASWVSNRVASIMEEASANDALQQYREEHREPVCSRSP